MTITTTRGGGDKHFRILTLKISFIIFNIIEPQEIQILLPEISLLDELLVDS